MKLRESRPCTVVFYAGARGRETPRAVRIEGREIPVERVLARRRSMDAATGDITEEFTCRLDDRVVTIRVTDKGVFLVG